MNIYAVSSGEYSDYKVLAIYHNKEHAEEYVRAFGGRVEEFPVDPEFPRPPAGMTRYHIEINEQTSDIYVRELYDDEYKDEVLAFDLNPTIKERKPWYQKKVRRWVTYVWAKDEQHAAKIGNEYRSRILTGNLEYMV